MQDRFTHKQLFFILLIGVVFFAILIYNFSIKRTFELIDKVEVYQEEYMSIVNASVQIEALNKELDTLDIVDENISYGNFQQELLYIITGYSRENKMTVQEFNEPHLYIQNDYITETSSITVNGNFFKVLEMIFYLEKEKIGGKVVAIEFTKERNKKSRVEELITKIYVQHIQDIKKS